MTQALHSLDEDFTPLHKNSNHGEAEHSATAQAFLILQVLVMLLPSVYRLFYHGRSLDTKHPTLDASARLRHSDRNILACSSADAFHYHRRLT
jgi:hypothetical protein